MNRLIFLDADNTLWDTNGVYRHAQEWMLAEVERLQGRRVEDHDRLAFVRAADQELAHHHHNGLGYPPRLLARALGFMLEGDPLERAAKRAWTDGNHGFPDAIASMLEAEFGHRLKARPSLRPGVAQAISRLQAAGATLAVLTEGRRSRVVDTLAHHGLADEIDKVVQARKDERLFRRIRRLARADEAYMVGDQLDRDIAPAKAAGLATIYFPGDFKPRWAPDVAKVAPDYVVTDLAEAADIILGSHVRLGDQQPRVAAKA
jgi:putative hydrolase of the HAD superfamily